MECSRLFGIGFLLLPSSRSGSPFPTASVKAPVSFLLRALRHQVRSRQTFSVSLVEFIGPDSVILLIAIHTALTIFSSRQASFQSGLYRYRWAAYTCWAVFSILLAALAFINSSSSYVSQGTFCYLPARPIWYRLALSWIPRYLILCTILGIYLAVYLYTKAKFGDFDAKFSTNSLDTEHSTQQSLTDRASSWPLPGLDVADSPKGAESSTETSSPILDSPIASPRVTLSKSYESVSGPPARPIIRTPTLLEALRDKALDTAANRRLESSSNAALRQHHKVIQRQLRYLFVYPLVYLAMWIPAFVNHCYLCQSSFLLNDVCSSRTKCKILQIPTSVTRRSY